MVKEIYPPRIQLAFRLTDAAGDVVKEGGRELRGLRLMTRGFADDTLRHEKALLDDWLRSEFTRPRSPWMVRWKSRVETSGRLTTRGGVFG